MRYASVFKYSRTWLMPSKYCSSIACTHGFSSILSTDLLPINSKYPTSGGRTVRRLFWMCSSLKRANSPISRGSSSKSLSRKPSYDESSVRNFMSLLFMSSYTNNLKIFQVANFWWEKLKVIVTKIECPQSFQLEEVSRQNILIQIVVR